MNYHKLRRGTVGRSSKRFRKDVRLGTEGVVTQRECRFSLRERAPRSNHRQSALNGRGSECSFVTEIDTYFIFQPVDMLLGISPTTRIGYNIRSSQFSFGDPN